MSAYKRIDLEHATRLIGHGPVVWVATKFDDEQYDIAPIAWNMPARKHPPRMVIGVGKRHLTYENIVATNEFVAAIPVSVQVHAIRNSGSTSGLDVDKFKAFEIEWQQAEKVDCRIPKNCLGYLECKVIEKVDTGHLVLFIADIVAAGADPDGFDGQTVQVDHAKGKTLHHLGDKVFACPSEKTDKPG